MKAHTRLKRIAALHRDLPEGTCAECGKAYPCPTAELAVLVHGTAVVTDGPRDGATFEANFDEARLNAQSKAVYEVVKDGEWHTLAEIGDRVGAPVPSVSARLRDFRKPQFGGVFVDRRRKAEGKGTFEYRLDLSSIPAPAAQADEDLATVSQAA